MTESGPDVEDLNTQNGTSKGVVLCYNTQVKILIALFGLSFFSFGSVCGAAESSLLDSLFSRAYHSESIYQDGKCGTNVLNFLKLLKKENSRAPRTCQEGCRVDWDNLKVLRFENTGYYKAWEGQLWAWDTRYGLGERNLMYVHYVIYFSGRVYDFDYKAKPTPEAIPRYLRNQFLSTTDSEANQIRSKEYQMTVYKGLDVLMSKKELNDLVQGKFFFADVISNPEILDVRAP